jgi:hypothetical protein
MMTGQWPNPTMAAAWQGMPATPMGQPDRPQRLAFLQAQANLLEQQLQALRDQIAGLKEE